MPRPDQLPPLAWVRAFRAAGEMGSFKGAAARLHVSPSTISHEIRKLEDWLQTPLFARTGRSVTLTAEGAALYRSVDAAFEQLTAAFTRFASGEEQPLRLGVLPFLASEFLLPRLREVRKLLGDRSVKLLSHSQLAGLTHPEPQRRLDAVVRYAEVAPTGYHSVPLTAVRLALVVSGHNPPDAEEAALPRVCLDGTFDSWATLEASGCELPAAAEPALVVDNYVAALRAVEQGLGIGVAVLPLTASWIAEGRLRLWREVEYSTPHNYWLVYPKESPHAAALEALGAWLAAEFAASSRFPA